jgi:glycosyltransferase involved in cell wall biosynthesis
MHAVATESSGRSTSSFDIAGFGECAERVARAAIFSTYPPQACGIGAFSFAVRSALLELPGIDDVSPVVVADKRTNAQQSAVLATDLQEERFDYVRAARLLGRLDIDVVLLQHEFGILGGADGEYVLSFAQQLAQPLVVTLHTILSQPSPHQLGVLTALCGQAERVIVMTETARRLLVDAGASAVEKIRVVPHGAPVVLGRRRDGRAAARRPLNVAPTPGRYGRVQSRLVLSTFGLLSAGKGLETAIKALPLIVERHPDVVYMIAGQTHPQVTRREGEQYRLMLERLVVDLALGDHVEFEDRFLSIDELADLLAVTDVFLTPYRDREQVASGALTFAIAAGCAAVSTPTGTRRTCSPPEPAGSCRSTTHRRSRRPCASSPSSPSCWRGRARSPAGSALSSRGPASLLRRRGCSGKLRAPRGRR